MRMIKEENILMNKMKMFSIGLILVLSLIGCGMKKDNNATNVTDTPVNEPAKNEPANDDAMNGNDITNNNGESKIEIADDAVDRLTAMEEVESANVLVTNRNAYVGVVLTKGVEGTDDLQDKISQEVRKAGVDFANVYVSLNPDFAKQLSDYGDKIRAGEPIEGFFKEFTDTVGRIFPTTK